MLGELKGGNYPKKAQCLHLLGELPLLPVEPDVVEIVRVYTEHKVMPNDPVGDALHLALVSYYKCDFLLTWNCRHLANANKFGHIRRINTLPGLFVPSLVTPLEMLGGENGEE
ncbi:MAG: hypothetical protein ACR2GR_04885 [Rhodothermales bacterium]